MIDFTSSLYLGMKHSSTELNGWQRLTTGVPAALWESTLGTQVGDHVAGMQGLKKGYNAQQFFKEADKNKYDLSPAMIKDLEINLEH